MWVGCFGGWVSELGSAGRWPAGGLGWYLRATGGLRAFARAAGGLEWYLWAISGLRAFAGRRPALLVERYGLAVLGCAWRVWERGPLARKQSCK